MSDTSLQSNSPSPAPSLSQPVIIRENIDSLSASLSDQIEMLAGELRSRWKSGQRVGVEQLGSAIEQVAKNEEQLLDLIYHEVLLREEFGEKPTLEDFAARFPQHVERLQRLFAVHGAIEDDGWAEELDSAFAEDAAATNLDEPDVKSAPSSTDVGDSADRKKSHWPRKPRDSRPVEPPPGYELLEEIGRGGMAVVFRAKQQILNRIVALKMLLAGGVANKEVLGRVQQEARAVAQLQHPGIVQIHEVGEHRGLPYLSLEYVAGGTLHEWLGGRPLPPLEAARIIEQLARTTHYAHEHGVVHRDLKPANVLLTERPPSLQSSATIPMGQVTPQGVATLARAWDGEDSNPRSGERGYEVQTKISDFGLARVLGSRSDLTATGQVIGTPSYMAPEQAAGTADDASPAQDIYSLGAILYELLTGRPPFRGSSLFDTLEQVRTTEAVPPRQLQPRVPRDLETICLKCLEKSPERRYLTAAALADDLRRVQDGDTISARPAGSFERTWKWVHRYPAISSLALLTVLLTIVGAAGIMREARRATLSEQQARHDKQRADILRIDADRQRDEAREQRRLAELSQKNAEQQRVIAEDALKQAEQQRTLADAERLKAEQAQAQAEASLDETMKAINSLAVLGGSLRNQPGQQALSKRLFDDTLQLYENLAKRQGDNPAVRRQRIRALINSGEILRSLRESEKAEKLLLQAAELIEAELKFSPDDPSLNDLATAPYWQLGVLYKDIGRPQESLEHFHKLLAVIDTVLQQQPDNIEFLSRKANAITNECVVLRYLGKGVEALGRYEIAIATWRNVHLKSSKPGAVDELAIALHDYSSQLRSLGRMKDFQAAFQESFDIRLKSYQQSPKATHTRTLLARMYVSHGYYDRADKKHELSFEQFGKAVELLQPNVDEYPDLYEHHRDLLTAMIEQLTGCLLTQNAELGSPIWQKVSERLLVARQKFPKDNWIAGHAANWMYAWADSLWENNQKDQATQFLKSAIQASIQLPSLATTPLTPQQESNYANSTAWVLAIAPDPSMRSVPKSVELARRAVELVPNSSFNVHTLGTALYYAGDYPAAREQLLKSIQLEQAADKRGTLEQLFDALKALPKESPAAQNELDESLGLKKPSPDALALHFSMLAMTLWKLGEQETARDLLRLVVDPPAGFSKDGPEARRLIGEARVLIQPK